MAGTVAVRSALGLALLLVLAGAGLWLLVRASGGGAPGTRGGVRPIPAEHGGVDAARAPPEAGAGRGAASDRARDAASGAAEPRTPPARSELPGSEAAAAARVWLEGRVVLPPGAPPEPDLAVVARARVGREGSESRAPPDAAGRFRVGLPEAARRATLELEGRYLHLDEPLAVDLSEVPGELLLEPRIGGRLEVRLALPAGTDPAALEGAVVRVQAVDGPHVLREAEADAAGLARLAALPAGRSMRLSAEPAGFVQRLDSRRMARVEAGHTAELELALEREVRIRGRVLDETGEPIAGVRVTPRIGGSGSRDHGTPAGTDAAGAFELSGVRSGAVELLANHAEHLEARLELGELRPGEVLEGVELLLPAGQRIAGTALWPDRTPAEGVWVHIGQRGSRGVWSHGASRARADAEGRFEIRGLRGGPLLVKASSRPPRAVRERLIASGHLPEGAASWVTHLARLEDVRPGALELLLVLEPAVPLRGRVVDAAGIPFERATVRVRRAGEDTGEATLTSLRDPEGAFRYSGLPPGSYELVASGGAGPGAAVRVELPQPGGAEALLIAPRGGRVAGRVLSAGEPVPGARVSLEGRRRFGPDDLSPHFHEDFRKRTASDAEGRFELREVAPGTHLLQAEAPAVGKSEPLELTLAAQESVPELILEIGATGWIEGRLAADVGRLERRRIAIEDVERHVQLVELTDSEGLFVTRDLHPGTYTVTLQGDGGGPGDRATAVAEVVPGRGTSVVLSSVPRRMRVLGRVLSAGEPVAGRRVRAHFTAEPELSPPAARTDARGRFEVELPRGGHVTFVFSGGAGAELRESRFVPQGDVVPLRFDLPSGAISGRLVGKDGKPAAGARVVLEPVRYLTARVPGQVYASRQTQAGAQGRFSFEHVAPGAYVLSGGGSGHGVRPLPGEPGAAAGEVVHGYARSGPIELLEGQRRADVALVLPAPGTISGRVRLAGGGHPERAWVQAVLEGGSGSYGAAAALETSDGRYRLRGLGPGAYTVRAALPPLREGGPPRFRSGSVTLTEGAGATLDLAFD